MVDQPMKRALVAAAALCLSASPALASQDLSVMIRGHALTLTLYASTLPGPPKGTVLMGSGDVGWVGLAADMADALSHEGYKVVGINVRQYLAAFRVGTGHLTPDQVPADYAAIVQVLRDRHEIAAPIIVSGVSEGAALAVLAASSPGTHTWIAGVITMGLPPTAELAWRWLDARSWITKTDANEPSFETRSFIAAISPVPLWMIQSTRDEYVTEADYRLLERTARAPSRLVLINASNHRFTDRRPELRMQLLAGLAWIRRPV
jgi:dienelactone hydrolase